MNSPNSGNLINNRSMNLGEYYNPLCYLCLVGSIVTSLSLTRKVAGSNNLFIFLFSEFSKNICGKFN